VTPLPINKHPPLSILDSSLDATSSPGLGPSIRYTYNTFVKNKNIAAVKKNIHNRADIYSPLNSATRQTQKNSELSLREWFTLNG